jgi:ABC-type transporter MlaC component
MHAALALLLALSAEETATEALRRRDAEIRAVLPPGRQPLSDPERRRVESVVSRSVDTHSMLVAALGTRWEGLPQSQRQSLTDAFARRFRRLGSFRIESLRDARIEYFPERSRGKEIVVPTRVTVGEDQSHVAYVMRAEGDGWRIVDIVTDDVSVVQNYSASFARVLAKEGVEGLIRRLERGGEAR